MGAETYTWVTKYRKNLADALQAAREETFAAGKFIGAGEHPATIDDAVELGAEEGTGSILDITDVSEGPELCSVCPVTPEELVEFFGTERPTFAQIEKCAPFWESFDRGEARAVTLYQNGKPAQICFAGWTIDAPAIGSGSFEDAKGKKRPQGSTKTKTIWGLWVNLIDATSEKFSFFMKTSPSIGDLGGLLNPINRGILQYALCFTDHPVMVRCEKLKAAFQRMLELTEKGFLRYSVKYQDDMYSSGGRGMSVPYSLDSDPPRSALFTGSICSCDMNIVSLSKDRNKIVHEEVTEVSGQKEVKLGDKTILILKKKINPLFDRQELASLLAELSKYDDNANIQIQHGDIPFVNDTPMIPESLSGTNIVSEQERATDLRICQKFAIDYDQAIITGKIQCFYDEYFRRMVGIFDKYSNDLEFILINHELFPKILNNQNLVNINSSE